MKNIINWKLFLILLAACVVASALVLPYALELASGMEEITAAAVKDPDKPGLKLTPALTVIVTAVQNLVMFAVVIFVGLLLSKRIGMGAPVLQGALEGTNQTKALKSIIAPSVFWGVVAGVLIILLSLPFRELIPVLTKADPPAVWKGFLASFYGGIAEEVLVRLFLMSLFVWITLKIKKTADGRPTNFGIWLSIILAAVAFGLGHLPITSQILPLTGLVVIRAIVLNGVGGVIFGWLYWKKGLESAIIAHFSADIVLHVITPAVLSFFK